MVVALILPKRMTRSVENQIRSFGAGILDGSRNVTERFFRLQEYVDMV